MHLSSIPRLLLALAGVLAMVLVSGTAAAQAPSQPFRVMTFNIRYNNARDSLDAWPNRAEGVARLIGFHDPDLLGMQEAQRNQIDDLQRLLPGYAWFGLPRNDGGPGDEYSTIFYRAERFDLLDQGTFWLSPTPEVPASRGWDAQLPRIATWGRFRDRATGDTILHVNTHFDHVGVTARAESARLLKRWLAENARGLPVLVTGDLNATPASEPIRTLLAETPAPRLADARAASAEPPYGPNSTWNGFQAVEPDRRIDFVFVGNGARVLEYAVLTDMLDNGRFPSDHLPVFAEVLSGRR